MEKKSITPLSEFAFMVFLALWSTLVKSLERSDHMIGEDNLILM